jgi:hypothetical protein
MASYHPPICGAKRGEWVQRFIETWIELKMHEIE